MTKNVSEYVMDFVANTGVREVFFISGGGNRFLSEALAKHPDLDWGIITSEAIEQAQHGDLFIILDLEETMNKLRHHHFIKKQYFDKLYQYQNIN